MGVWFGLVLVEERRERRRMEEGWGGDKERKKGSWGFAAPVVARECTNDGSRRVRERPRSSSSLISKRTKEMGKEVGNQGEKGNQKKVHKEVPTWRDTHRGARIPIESRDGSA